MKSKAITRESGIELLRIISALFVVVLHYNSIYAFKLNAGNQTNLTILYVLESICICAVNLFVLISGYFLSKSQKRSPVKIISLFAQVIIFNCLFYFVDSAIHHSPMSIKSFFLNFIPNNYFVTLYSVLYFISPFLNHIFEKLNRRQWKIVLIASIVIFSILPTAIDLFTEVTGHELNGLSPITAFGNARGFNIVNFALLYMVGAYIRYNNPSVKHASLKLIICIALTFGWSLVCDHLHPIPLQSSWVYHNPLVIAEAALFFIAFKQLRFKSGLVNNVAASSFTIYLLHTHILLYANVKEHATESPFVLLLHILATCLVSLALSYVTYRIYSLLSAPIEKVLNRTRIFRTRKISLGN